ncbi:globin [Micromonospora sp. WMMA2032]|uniref:globin n=1 Tax=Micromonospora sp. WMMA2032 TaxID=2039870 RepID=UPI0020A33C08|nr:globin [Micromonospora sp. WMMA2032]
MTCSREPRDRLGPVAVREAVHRWLRLVAADAELAPYLLGVDRRRLAAVLADRLGAALGVLRPDPRSPFPGEAGALFDHRPLTEEQRWRVLDYLAAALWVLDLPVRAIVDAQRAVAGLLRA